MGILTNKELERRIIKYDPISPRIITIHIQLKSVVVVIQIYGPTEGTEEEKVIEFYAELQRAVDTIREQQEKIIIIGDWNARVGRDVNRGLGSIGGYGEETLNRNGRKMLEFCQINELLIGNTFWEQEMDDKYTFIAEERDSKSLIDYIVFTKNLEKDINNIRTEKEPELSTQHRMVTATLRDIITRLEERKKYYKININKFKEKNIQEKYRKETDEKLKRIERTKEVWTLEDRWTTFKETIKEEAKKICGMKCNNNKHKRTRWWNEEVKKEIKKKKQAWKRYITTRNEQDKEEYNTTRRRVKNIIKNAKRKSWEDFGNEIQESYTSNNRRFWARVRAMKEEKRKEIAGVKDKQNNLQTNVANILRVWKEYFEDKFNTETEEQEQDNEQEAEEAELEGISRDEIKEAMQNIKTGKAGGEDKLDPEMIKYLGEQGIDWFWKICNTAWESREIPSDWENNLVIPIHKKGERANCDNYRAICLASSSFKIYTKIIEKRVRQIAGNEIEDEQAAFMPGRQTNDNICIIRNIIERSLQSGEETILAFIDLRAAFDSIEREVVWNCLEEINIPKSLIQIIRSTYNRVKGKVQIAGTRSDEFEWKKGIKQGDSLSPLLFIIIMNKLIRKTRERTKQLQTIIGYQRLEPMKLEALMYADDIVLIADSKKKIQRLIDIWVEEIEMLKMEVNIEKSKIMIINEREQDNTQIKCKDIKLEEVTTFEYLGSIITNDGNIDVELANRAKKSNKLYYALRALLGKTEMNIETKLRIYNTIILPTLIYACENWTIQKKHIGKLDAMEMKHLRKIAGKTKWDGIRNNIIRETIKQEPIGNKVIKRQLNWYGHLTRMNTNKLVKKVWGAKSHRKRKRGRPRKTWLQQIIDVGKEKGKTMNELKTMTANRVKWKKWVNEEIR